MSKDPWKWIRVPVRAIERAIKGLKELSMQAHDEAFSTDDPEEKHELRIQADEDAQHAKDIKTALESDEDPPTYAPRKKH